MKMPGNMQNMMKQAQQMQAKLQEQVAAIRVEASAGGGMITVKMDGHKNVLGVKIDPEVAGDVEMLQDMVMAAFNEAAKKVDDEVARQNGRNAGRPRSASRHVLSSYSMPEFAEPLARLIQECKRLPGIGQKSAQRIAFHLLRTPREDAQQLAQAILDIKDKLGICAQCNNISDGELCLYCRDPHREHVSDLRCRRAPQYPAD